MNLREHLELRLTSLREYIDTRLADEQRAKELALRDVAEKFAKVNELREQVLQERGMYPRVELLDGLRDRVAVLEGLAQTRAHLMLVPDRVARLERILPIVALASAIMGAIATTLAMRLFGITAGS